MKLPPFTYLRPSTIAEACAMLQENPGARILAGGQSLLVQMMNGARAATLIDINRITDFPPPALADGALAVPALTRHAELAAHAPAMRAVPVLAQALRHVAHPAIRNRGTVCGSLAFADPAAELPAIAMLLNATLTLASVQGQRRVPARAFFKGPFSTACGAHEFITEALFPATLSHQRAALIEIGARANDPAAIGVALKVDKARGSADAVLFGAAQARVLCAGLPLAPARLGAAVAAAFAAMLPQSGRARLHQARVLAERALAAANG